MCLNLYVLLLIGRVFFLVDVQSSYSLNKSTYQDAGTEDEEDV
jgi:hypothetical protein